MTRGLVWYLQSDFFIPTVALISFLTASVAARLSGFGGRSLSKALMEAFETLGIAAFIFVLNLALGIAVLDAARWITGQFVSHYMIQEWTVPCFSLFEALVLKYWIDWKNRATADRRMFEKE